MNIYVIWTYFGFIADMLVCFSFYIYPFLPFNGRPSCVYYVYAAFLAK